MAKNKTVVMSIETLTLLIAQRERSARLDELERLAPLGGKLIIKRINAIKQNTVSNILLADGRKKTGRVPESRRYLVLNNDSMPSEFENIRQYIVREKD